MFQRLKQLFRPRPLLSPSADSPVSRWATSQFLLVRPGESGRFSIDGQLQGFPFRVECGEPSRPYIEGLELRALVDLILPPVGHVVVMSRVVQDALAGLVNGSSPPSWPSQDERRWFTHLEENRWSGPPEQFWARYTVRSDEPELAQRWLDHAAIEFLTLGDSEAAAKVPVVISLRRGKCYLRVQINPQAQDADTLLALELLEHLAGRALKLAARRAHRA